MDDILCETAISLCDLAFRLFGKRVAYESVTDFNLQRTFALNDTEFRRFMDVAHEPENLLAYATTPGAVEAVQALIALGHTMEVVTGRPASTYRATRDWLNKVGFGACPVIFVDKYARTSTVLDPNAPRTIPLVEFMTRHYDVAIDDSPVILPTLAEWKDTRIMVFDRPWNHSFVLKPNMTRIEGWKELMKVIGC